MNTNPEESGAIYSGVGPSSRVDRKSSALVGSLTSRTTLGVSSEKPGIVNSILSPARAEEGMKPSDNAPAARVRMIREFEYQDDISQPTIYSTKSVRCQFIH